LTLASNKVRTSTDLTWGSAEAPVGADPRFTYDYAAVPQKLNRLDLTDALLA
jgi:hypothetical protein